LLDIQQQNQQREDTARLLTEMFPAAEFRDSDDDDNSDASDDEVEEKVIELKVAEIEEPDQPLAFADIIPPVYDVDYSDLDRDFPAVFRQMTASRALVAIGATRWMTYVDMARRFILWRWAIQNAMQEVVKLKPIGETPIDWSFSQDQLDILSHFVIVGDAAQEVLIRLQGSLAPTISCLLYNYVVLQRNMVQWAGDDSELCPQIQLFCKHVATNLDLKFNPDADRTSLIAALLDPRYRKLEFLEDYPLAQKSGRDALKQEWTKLQHDSSPDRLSRRQSELRPPYLSTSVQDLGRENLRPQKPSSTGIWLWTMTTAVRIFSSGGKGTPRTILSFHSWPDAILRFQLAVHPANACSAGSRILLR
jgi:hypothetical protein